MQKIQVCPNPNIEMEHSGINPISKPCLFNNTLCSPENGVAVI